VALKPSAAKRGARRKTSKESEGRIMGKGIKTRDGKTRDGKTEDGKTGDGKKESWLKRPEAAVG
jgi:hypothetical protein